MLSAVMAITASHHTSITTCAPAPEQPISRRSRVSEHKSEGGDLERHDSLCPNHDRCQRSLTLPNLVESLGFLAAIRRAATVGSGDA